MIAPDETTFAWVAERARRLETPRRVARAARPTRARRFDREIAVDARAIARMVTWGTNPGQVAGVTDAVPEPTTRATSARSPTWT